MPALRTSPIAQPLAAVASTVTTCARFSGVVSRSEPRTDHAPVQLASISRVR